MKHIMLDLETMGTSGKAAITSIGAVYFSKDGLEEEFSRTIDLQSCVGMGLEISISTVEWWMKQSEEARKALFINRAPLRDVLDSFSTFCSSSAAIWGNGSDFDNVILTSAYKAIGKEIPWKYYNNRCFRTLKNLYPEIEPPARVGAHNSLEDAKYQALHAISILNTIGKW
jgi:DNA polymerase III epsilon subunit-like protein